MIILKGDATVGSITDIDGNFDLSVPSNATLQVSYIGYNTQDVSVGNKSFLNITLKEDTETLDEVVVVGYGSQKKVNVAPDQPYLRPYGIDRFRSGGGEADAPLVRGISSAGRGSGRGDADRKSTRLNSSHITRSRMPSSA